LRFGANPNAYRNPNQHAQPDSQRYPNANNQPQPNAILHANADNDPNNHNHYLSKLGSDYSQIALGLQIEIGTWQQSKKSILLRAIPVLEVELLGASYL
jgi:hypothetical protein